MDPADGNTSQSRDGDGQVVRRETISKRVRKPAWLPWLLGLILVPAVLALITGLVRHGSIEKDLKGRTTEALKAGGVSDAGVKFDGRDGTITLPDGADAAKAKSLAKNVDGVRVADVKGGGTAAAPAPAPSSTEPSPTESSPSPSPSSSADDCATLGEKLTALLKGNEPKFATASTKLQSATDPTLDKVANLIKGCPTTKFQVGGYTDNTGDASFNKTLSQGRAQSVVDYLVGKGDNKANLSAKGYGSANPVGDNKTEEGRAQNRRVEITVVGG
ncbi:OmpA family protein [Flexivirga meconopsidis]|uniref:OmpA family protein n=1 Tax=Flexivirga meconopsidis TaxID=2977121 RepID=UPI0022405D6C|nr:OmpA family protein [Flexivirga meconopsidis]